MKTLRARILVPLILGAAACGSAECLAEGAGAASSDKAAHILAESVCVHCHGANGRSSDPAVPIIAGQQKAYLEAQLKTFRAQRARDPDAGHYMWGISATWLMDDQLLSDISAYFAQQSPPAGRPGDAALVSQGKTLYETPNPQSKLPSCARCHGAEAEGLSVFPRLAGQHGAYLTQQMRMQQVGLRDVPPMHNLALGSFGDVQIQALAAYLQSK